jgi:hypothetical protein
MVVRVRSAIAAIPVWAAHRRRRRRRGAKNMAQSLTRQTFSVPSHGMLELIETQTRSRGFRKSDTPMRRSCESWSTGSRSRLPSCGRNISRRFLRFTPPRSHRRRASDDDHDDHDCQPDHHGKIACVWLPENGWLGRDIRHDRVRRRNGHNRIDWMNGLRFASATGSGRLSRIALVSNADRWHQ